VRSERGGPDDWRWARLLVFWALFAQLLGAATQLSATVDEAFHTTSGYEYLRTGRVRLFDEHPPVVKALLAWPLAFVPDLRTPESGAGYGEGDLIAVAQETVLAYRPLDRVIVGPRVAAALLALLLAASICRAGCRLAGDRAGLLALGLLAFDPNFVAHGSLATTDIGATALIFWAVWAGGLWIARSTRQRWAIAALCLGLAQGAKLTALLIFPVLGAAWLLAELRARPPSVASASRKAPRADAAELAAATRRLLGLAGVVLGSLVVLWALYGFEVRSVMGVLGGSVSLPGASHIERWLRLQENIAYGREAYLLGQNSMHGWPLYFPVAFLTKTPLPLLVLLVWALGRWIGTLGGRLSSAGPSSGRPSTLWRGRPQVVTLVAFPLLYGLASLTSTLNIGYRHLLPVLPFAYLGAAVTLDRALHRGAEASRPRAWPRLGIGLLLVWMVVGALRVAPHGLAYFNELAGGPDGGWRFLADSNTDWGQTFKALAAYQRETGTAPVKLSSFTFYDPAAYGVVYEPIAPMVGAPPVLPRRLNPAPGIYAISATTLNGVPLSFPWTYDWFRHREPFARIGHAMFLYEVSPIEGGWIAQCSTPVVPLSGPVLAEGLGAAPLRQLAFDCEQSWVLPGGSVGGWYARAIPEQTQLRWPRNHDQREDLLPEWVTGVVQSCLSLSYLQPRNSVSPAFVVWEGRTCDLPIPGRPVVDGEPITFLGLIAPESSASGRVIEVLTTWEIGASEDRPLSLMLHLADAEGMPVAIGDGLGYPQAQWQAGDRLIQRHILEIPANTAPGPYALRTGAYWLDALEPIGETSMVPLAID
jgi:hypothetical protein